MDITTRNRIDNDHRAQSTQPRKGLKSALAAMLLGFAVAAEAPAQNLPSDFTLDPSWYQRMSPDYFGSGYYNPMFGASTLDSLEAELYMIDDALAQLARQANTPGTQGRYGTNPYAKWMAEQPSFSRYGTCQTRPYFGGYPSQNNLWNNGLGTLDPEPFEFTPVPSNSDSWKQWHADQQSYDAGWEVWNGQNELYQMGWDEWYRENDLYNSEWDRWYSEP